MLLENFCILGPHAQQAGETGVCIYNKGRCSLEEGASAVGTQIRSHQVSAPKKAEKARVCGVISIHSIVCQVTPQGQRLSKTLKPQIHLSNEILHRTLVHET